MFSPAWDAHDGSHVCDGKLAIRIAIEPEVGHADWLLVGLQPHEALSMSMTIVDKIFIALYMILAIFENSGNREPGTPETRGSKCMACRGDGLAFRTGTPPRITEFPLHAETA